MTDMDAFIRGMPKAELHVHVEGTLEPEQRLAFARRNGIAVPYGMAEQLAASYSFQNLTEFLALYFDGIKVLITEQDFFELTYAYLERVHRQNVVYTEMHFDPQAHTTRGVAFDTAIRGIHRAQVEAQERLGIRSQLIMAFLRDLSAESAMETLEQSLPYKDWIVGIGLDSEERDNPPVKFAEVYKRAKAEGYRLTAHCDQDQKDSVQHIWQCLDVLGVERIDHGVNSLDEDALADEVKRRGICLTVCLTSTPSHPGPRRTEHLQAMLDRGMKATVNTDDPAYMLSYYMNEVLINTQQALGLSREQVVLLNRNAFESAWVTPEERDAYLARLDAYAG